MSSGTKASCLMQDLTSGLEAGRLSSTRLRLCSIKDIHQKVLHLDDILLYRFWQLACMHHYSYFGKLV